MCVCVKLAIWNLILISLYSLMFVYIIMNRILKFFFFRLEKNDVSTQKKTSCFVLLCHFFQESCYVIITREREDSCFKNKNNEKQAKMKWPNVWLVGWLVVIIIITSEDGQWRKRRIMFVCLFVCLSICQFLSEKKNIKTFTQWSVCLFVWLSDIL